LIAIYAEKPDMGEKIAKALSEGKISGGRGAGKFEITYMGKPCVVTWGFGHMCELMQGYDYNPEYNSWSKLPVPFIPEKFRIKPRSGTDERGKAQMKTITDTFKKADLIINATDYDREGEVIFGYVYEWSKCKTPYKRAHFTSVTPSGIKDGFSRLKPESEVKPVETAGRARACADWLVGANITAGLTLKNPGDGVWSVGRVQTPTLAMTVTREKAIRDFKPEAFFTVNAVFTKADGEKYKGEHRRKRFSEKKDADDIFSRLTGNATVTDVRSRRVFKEAPGLYSLSALQMDANGTYGMMADKTLDAAQKLYEKGYTTYPRTDTGFLTEDAEPVVNKVLDMLEKDPEYGAFIKGHGRKIDRKKYFDDSKVGSHYAIIPTDVPAKGLSGDEEKIYGLIARSVVRMIYGPAETEKTAVTTTDGGEDFVSQGTVIVKPGWLDVFGKLTEEALPALSEGEGVSGEYEVKAGKTEPPKRYTDKTLIAAMKTAGKELADAELKRILADPSVQGIGTEATRASIIKTLAARGYIERKGTSIIPTERGMRLIDILPVSALKSAELTAKWEQRLSDMEKGADSFEDFMGDIGETVGEWCGLVSLIEKAGVSRGGPVPKPEGEKKTGGTGPKCPLCGAEIRKTGWGWGCSGYRDGCKFSVGTICGKKLSDAQIKDLIVKGATKKLSGFTGKSGKKFDATLRMKEGKISFDFS
jgi:DNA topoisomerase-3